MIRPRREDGARPARRGEVLTFVLIVLGVWLAWRIVVVAAVERLPHETALRLAPNSASALARAADEELQAGRFDNAEWLARRSLAIAPFSAKALRISGLAVDGLGDNARANELLTLAGNWSLRDGPAHHWLVQHRIEQGNFPSALAHADAILRRRGDLRAVYFGLLTRAAIHAPQARAPLAEILSRQPPWRSDFVRDLNRTDEGQVVSMMLAASLKERAGAYSDDEMARLYGRLLAGGRLDAVSSLRHIVEGEARSNGLIDGGFDQPAGQSPFGWRLPTEAGLMAEIAPGSDGKGALHALMTDASSHRLAEQTLMLRPGRYRLSARLRVDQGEARDRLFWSISCFPPDREIERFPAQGVTGAGGWFEMAQDFTLAPACKGQALRLVAASSGRRSTLDVWVDDVRIEPH